MITSGIISQSVQNMACYLKWEAFFMSFLFWGKANWYLNWLNHLNYHWELELWLNLLDWNVNEREFRREKVQMKPPIEYFKKLESTYHTRSFITRGLYTFSHVHLCTVTFGLMYGLYSRAVSDQEGVIWHTYGILFWVKIC